MNGGLLKGSRTTYALVCLVTLVSVFPLYYTIVMASHTNAEMAASTPPILPNPSVLDHVKKAPALAPLHQGLIKSVIVAGALTIGTVALSTLAGRLRQAAV